MVSIIQNVHSRQVLAGLVMRAREASPLVLTRAQRTDGEGHAVPHGPSSELLMITRQPRLGHSSPSPAPRGRKELQPVSVGDQGQGEEGASPRGRASPDMLTGFSYLKQ